jgi:hypothetical protein
VLRGDPAETDRAEAAGWESRGSSPRGQHRSDRTHEILFIDRGVADFPTILRSLQPGIEAILLERDRPAARQIATALARRPGLGTLHVLAHGAPGRVSFASGDWSLETLAEEIEDFTAIGEALGPDGRLCLWSCRTGAGAAGAAFLEGLARKTGADVAAAAGFVGAAALGGAWVLATRSRSDAPEPPLTAAGIAAYAGVLVTNTYFIGFGINSPFQYLSTVWDRTLPSDGWFLGIPPTSGGEDLVFLYSPFPAAFGAINTSVLTMPPSLLQATGSGAHTWILNDDLASSETSSLTLVNQGQIFVNDTNTLTRTSTTTNWVFEGDPTPEQVGNQILQNDGAINVIGTTGVGTTTASFFDGNTNLTVTGSGEINVYGNANVIFGLGVGVSASQTVNFVPAGGDTSGTVMEVDATVQDAKYGGLLAGDTLILQNLGGTPDSETVIDSNGFATVNIMSGATILDSVTFRLGFHF